MPRRGGFHDLQSFRAETGLNPDDINDQEVYQVLYEDMKEQKRIADKNKQEEEEKRRRAEKNNNLQVYNQYEMGQKMSDLARENFMLKNNLMPKKKSILEMLEDYETGNVNDVYRHLQRERLKKEIKEELKSSIRTPRKKAAAKKSPAKKKKSPAKKPKPKKKTTKKK